MIDRDGDVGYYKFAKAAAYIRYGTPWRGSDAAAPAGATGADTAAASAGAAAGAAAGATAATAAAPAGGKDRGVLFVATNPDQASPLGPGGLVPGGGAFLSFIETSSGRAADLMCGKPSKALGDAIKTQFAIQDPSKVMMWGDRTNTDVKFGNRAGFHSCVVLTGVSTPSDVAAAEGEERPDFVSPCVGELLRALE